MEPNPVALHGKVEEVKQDEPVQEEVIETKKEEQPAQEAATAKIEEKKEEVKMEEEKKEIVEEAESELSYNCRILKVMLHLNDQIGVF